MLKPSQQDCQAPALTRFTFRRNLNQRVATRVRKVELPDATLNQVAQGLVNMNTGAAPIPLPPQSSAKDSLTPRFPSRFARFGAFELDIQRQELYRSGIRIRLQTKVYEALLVLLEAPHEIVSREIIQQQL